MSMKKISRREFLKGTGIGAALIFTGGTDIFRQGIGLFGLPAAKAFAMEEPFMPDAEITIRSLEKWVQIIPGMQTRVWGYEGELLSGSGVTVQNLPNNYLGPIIRAKKGTKVRIYYKNELGEVSVIHPHGLRVPEDCDGQPMQAIGTDETKIYDFEVIDRAGPYWFHPHPMMRTAYQVVMGMAGLFYVWDDDELNAVPGADSGANDIPLVLQDRAFDSSNQILYTPNQMWGYLGDRILVNGQLNTVLKLEPRAYRLRVINGSNARTYKLAWSNKMPLMVIGTDGGLLPVAASRNYAMLMPGERLDIWADFSKLGGKQVTLNSLSFSPGGGMGGGMGGGGMGGGGMGSTLPNGSAFNILTASVSRKSTSKPILGPLPPMEVIYNAENVPNYATPRPFTLDMRMMTWTINGRVYEEMVAADDEMVYRDESMAWEWINNSPIPHPMHMHNVQFQVVQRTPSTSSSYGTVNQGFVDSGWKDTVLVWPGEKVKVAMNFGPHMGMYMYHCHILEHEDMGMMRNYMIMDPMMPEM